jgi:two-component system LytT family response regulator
MITAVHIEDEPRNIELLKTLIENYCGNKVSLLGNAKNITDAITLIKKTSPQLVYLDIELNQGNAFDSLNELKDFKFQVIFITAFNEYAVKAFRLNAIDYLLKPISTSELIEATDKAIDKINQHNGNDYLIEMLKQFQGNINVQKIGVAVNDGVVFINHEDIIKAEAKGTFCVYYLINGKTILSTKSLKTIEMHLPVNTFIRVHHSWIINTNHLKKYYRGKKGYMEMDDGSTVPVSQRKKSRFLELFGE